MGCKSVRGSCGTIDSQHRFFRAKQVAQGNLFGHELWNSSKKTTRLCFDFEV